VTLLSVEGVILGIALIALAGAIGSALQANRRERTQREIDCRLRRLEGQEDGWPPLPRPLPPPPVPPPYPWAGKTLEEQDRARHVDEWVKRMS
jgi:hypothetical protein